MSIISRKVREFLLPSRWLLSRAETSVATAVENVKPTEPEREGRRLRRKNSLLEYRHAFPEFLPDPNPLYRNSLREKFERADMLNRRRVIDIPEFYVGTIMAVTISDPDAQGKTNRFVGICIERTGTALRSEFTLRNVVNQQGIEIRYELYDPAIQRIQVLRLEKRLDDKLMYLRDALPEYYTYSQDMEPEILPEGTPVPVNTTLVRLKPRPWLERWERQDLRGVANIDEYTKYRHRKSRDLAAKPWEKYDLMKTYRKAIPEEEQNDIWSEVHTQLQQLQQARRKMARRKSFSLPADKL